MTANARDAGPDAPRIDAKDIPVGDMPVFDRPDQVREYLGTQKQIAEIDTMLASRQGQDEVMQAIHEQSPGVDGNGRQAVEQFRLNTDQLVKKESFLKKIAMYPLRHPFITAIGALALSALITPFGANILSKVEAAMAKVPLDKIIESLKKFTGLSGAATEVAEPGILGPNIDTV